MKIKVSQKADAAKNALDSEKTELSDDKNHLFKRHLEHCFDHRLLLLLMLGVCIFSYFLMYHISLRMYAQYNQGPRIFYETKDGKLYRVHFSWRNCGNKEDPMQLSNLQVLPDPVILDKNITIDLISSLGIDIDADHPLSADITLERHIGFIWVEIPCVLEVGSCFYEDICKVIPFTPDEPCPDPFPRFNVPCHCPIKHGAYNIRNGTFNLSAILEMIPLPQWLASGDYYGKVIASQKGKEMGCYEVYASVKS
ncbi:ganglioside GM2 activator-like [Palaemon carinicauda]|uniref:ganglioside GM2 activator-like n=1 Tax=Palaemon carinicauda TaxID=392227 RepID=UPI0035B5C706